MDLNEKPTNLLESELDQEIARSFKKLSQGDGRNFVAMDKDVNLKDGIQDKDNRLLRSKVNELELQTVELEGEVKVLRERNGELELRVASMEKGGEVNCEDKEDLLKSSKKSLMNDEKMEGDEEIVVQLMVEISVLQCEKHTAEREVKIWKQKCKELESRLLAVQGRSSFSGKQLTSIREREKLDNDGNTSAAVNKGIQNGGTRCVMTSDEPVNFKNGIEVIDLDGVGYSTPPRKQLFCGDDETGSEKTAPCTPAGARPRTTFTIDTIDADAKHHISSGTQGYNVLTPFKSKEAVPYSKASTIMCEGDEDMSDCSEKISFVATPKRKRSLNVVTSDTESDNDDNIPIGQLVRNKEQPLVPQPAVSESDVDSDCSTRKRHRLVKLSQTKGSRKTPSTDESENDEDDDSLGNFIVSGSDDSEIEEEDSDVAQDFSDDNSDDFDGLLHKMRTTKDHASKWELEGDMLAAFGKDPILCMKAVCALFRQQTCDEQVQHATFVSNRRGFSTFDAPRGTELALFLTDENPNGDVTRSVKQLTEFDPLGVETCRTLAARYSKQLFEIYQNGEDPHFFPQSHLDSEKLA